MGSRLLAGVGVGVALVLVVGVVPGSAAAGVVGSPVVKPSKSVKSVKSVGPLWSAEVVPALLGSGGSGALFVSRAGVEVSLRSLGVTPTQEPVLVLDRIEGARQVRFSVESVTDGQVTTSPVVGVRDHRAAWRVPVGVMGSRLEYRVRVQDAAAGGRVLLARNLLVDLQRAGEQQEWGFAGVSVTQVTGEPIVSWGSSGLSTLEGVAGFSLMHRPTNGEQAGVPAGWQLAASSVGSRWKSLTLTRGGDVARLTGWDGWSVTFERDGFGGEFVALLGPHDGWPGGMYATLSENPGGGWEVTNTNLSVTTFPAADTSSQVTVWPSGVWVEGSPVLAQSWAAGRLDHVSDPVSGRRIQFHYGPSDECVAPADGFIAVPAGLLCAVTTWDGTKTAMSYVATDAGAQIGRITEGSGLGAMASVSDYAWDRSGRVTGMRTPLAVAAIAAGAVPGLGAQDARALTTVAYDSSGRVVSITAPASVVPEPTQTPAQNYRPVQRFEYDTDRAGRALFTATEDDTDVDFLAQTAADPVTMDQTRATGPSGDSVLTTWNEDDQATEMVDQASGTRTRTLYDEQGRAVRTIGPSQLAMNTRSGASVLDTSYDTYDADPDPVGTDMRALHGLVMISWDGIGMTGLPDDRSIVPAVGPRQQTQMPISFGANPSGAGGAWAGRLAGTWTAPAPQRGREEPHEYAFRPVAGRLWVNGARCTTVVPCRVSLRAGAAAQLQADVTSGGDGGATVDLQVARDGGRWEQMRTADTGPGLNEVTEQLTFDQLRPGGRPVELHQIMEYDWASGSGNLVKQTSAAGTVISNTWDTYTGQDGHYGQHLTFTGPAGAVTTYGYHPATTPVARCGESAVQGGMLATTSSPSVTSAQTYTAAGAVASATGEGTSTCINHRADGSASGGQVTGDGDPYSASAEPMLDGNPLRSSSTTTLQGVTTSSSASISITGKPHTSTDSRGTTTTTTYDPVTGHPTIVTETTAQNQTRTFRYYYDRLGRSTSATLTINASTLTLHTTRYRRDGTIAEIRYANNTTSTRGLDEANNPDQVTYAGFTGGHGGKVSEHVDYSQGDAILARDLHGADGDLRQQATYDLDHRMTAATATGSIPVTTRSTNLTLSANGNRTTQTTTSRKGTTTKSTSTFDAGDKLLTTTTPGVGTPTYDSHGRTTSIGASTLAYDAAGHLTDLTGPRGTLTLAGDGSTTFTPTGGGTPITLRPSGDLLLDANGLITAQIITLPGGATVALDANGTPLIWQYTDLQGSPAWTTTSTTNRDGTTRSPIPAHTTIWDPWGTKISTNTTPTPTTPLQLAMSMNGWKGTTTPPTGNDLVIMGAREYSPTLGRFLQRDPYTGGSTNTYQYALGDPWNATDPGGTLSWSLGKTLALVVSVIGGAVLTMATGGAYGAIAAWTTGAAVKTLAGAAVGAVKGAAIAAAASATQQAVDTGDIDPTRLGFAVGIGGAVGGLFGAIDIATRLSLIPKAQALYQNESASIRSAYRAAALKSGKPGARAGFGTLAGAKGALKETKAQQAAYAAWKSVTPADIASTWHRPILALSGVVGGAGASATDSLGGDGLTDAYQDWASRPQVAPPPLTPDDPTIDAGGSGGTLLDDALGG